jgi:lipopolysaccharide/colanic/teichoic acid biosynthesis glycosyltransferase
MRIFSFILPVRVSALILSEFLITISCYLIATAIAFRVDTFAYLQADHGLLRLLLVSSSILLGLFVNNLYADTRVDSRVQLVLKMCNVAGIALIVQGLLAYTTSGLSLPRSIMLWGTGVSFLTLLVWRMFYGGVLLRMLGTQNILFVGKDEIIEEIASRIRLHPELGFGISGYLDTQMDGQTGQNEDGSALGECLGLSEDLAIVVQRVRPKRIVIGVRDRRADLPVATLLTLVRSGITIEDAATTYEAICGRVSSAQLRASQIIFRNELASRPGSLALQSIYANLVAISGIALTSPVLILGAIAVKLTSRGPVLEPDTRIGQHGIPFNLNKFRCHRLPANSSCESFEERLTPVGKWLQMLHFENLPRVLNLLRGEITLVGPRPEKPEFVDELTTYFAYYRQRLSVKPGLTGWSQINLSDSGQSTDSLVQLEYDLYYTKNISLALDAYILLHGIRQVLPFARH